MKQERDCRYYDGNHAFFIIYCNILHTKLTNVQIN